MLFIGTGNGLYKADKDPSTVYFGFTDASVWKTGDGGQSFRRVLDLMPASSGENWRANAVTSICVA